RLPADPARLSSVRRAVAAWTAAAGMPADTAEDLQLALGEALANAVEHAYAASGTGECTYRVARQADGGVSVEVCDTGMWRPPPEDRGHRGRGLELIDALATDVEVVHVPGTPGTTVRFRMPAAVPEPDALPQRGILHPAGDGGAALLAVHDEPGGLRLEIHGEVDLATAGKVREQLLARLDQLPAGTVATLDLRPTGYLASAGVGMVLEALARAGEVGVELRVRSEQGTSPARILSLAGVGEPAPGVPVARPT
ncbi:STAS domain-containing protein, partial [Geodermatophilus sp. DF01-2]|uniref:ATP-binding protein n=1 Tax=Geodermatophilus sp. DF01-2 TaxID=2559610 RepID=UPI0010742F64